MQILSLVKMAASGESLPSVLIKHELDPEYWCKILESEFSVKTYQQAKLLKDESFKKLEKCVRYPWEVNALKEFLGLTIRPIEQKKEEAKQQHKVAKQLIQELQEMNDAKIKRLMQAKKMNNKKKQLHDLLDISDEDWKIYYENKSLEMVLDKFSSELHDLETFSSNSPNLSYSEVIKNASDGLVLRGILVTRKMGEYSKARDITLEVPEGAQLGAAIISQTDGILECSSQSEFDELQKVCEIMGHNCVGDIKGGDWGFEIETKAEHHAEDSESHHQDSIQSCEIFCIVPVASYKFNSQHIKLSTNAIERLKEIDTLLDDTGDTSVIHRKCEEFMEHYGSHVNTGIIHFGGVYKWVAEYSSHVSSTSTTDTTIVQDTINAYKSMSYSSIDASLLGPVSGDFVKARSRSLASYNDLELRKVLMHTQKNGGPPNESSSLPFWKKGLALNNNTWSVIDRGRNLSTDFMGIWEMIPRQSTQFQNSSMIAKMLQETWSQLNGINNVQEIDIYMESGKTFDEIEEQVKIWLNEGFTSQTAVQHLEFIVQHVEKVYSTPEPKAWMQKISQSNEVSGFLLRLIEMEHEYSPTEKNLIRDSLQDILQMIGSQEFPNKNQIKAWVDNTGETEKISLLPNTDKIQDIPSFLAAIEKELIPSMEKEYLRTPEREDNLDIDKQAMCDLVSTVGYLQHLLKEAGKQYELLFLNTVMHQLTFNPDSSERRFEGLINLKKTQLFLSQTKEDWNGYKMHERKGKLQCQAYLMLLVLRELRILNEQQRQEQLLKHISSVYNALVPEIMELFIQQPFKWQDTEEKIKFLCDRNARFRWITPVEEILNDADLCQDALVPGDDQKIYPRDETIKHFLEELGLLEYYPSKISISDVMKIGRDTTSSRKDLPWSIMQKLIMLNYNARDGEISKIKKPDDAEELMNHGPIDEIDDIMSTLSSSESLDSVNPLDCIVAILSCCDLMLKQTLTQKMFMCHLAVPFIMPLLSGDSLCLFLWALRTIIVEWKDKQDFVHETSIISQPLHVVSFVRLGRPSFSKSKLLNKVLHDKGHDTHFNTDCPEANTDRHIANGLVEASWYQPSGKQADTFNEVTMFLNLRGDAADNGIQMDMLGKICTAMVMILDVSDIERAPYWEMLCNIHSKVGKVILLILAKDTSINFPVRKLLEEYKRTIGDEKWKDVITPVLGFTKGNNRSIDDVKVETRKAVSNHLKAQQDKTILEEVSVIDFPNLCVDEKDPCCQKGKHLANMVTSCLESESNISRSAMLPLQGELWVKYSELQKKLYGSGRKDEMATDTNKLEQDIVNVRKKQVEAISNINLMMQKFITALIKGVNDSKSFACFLQWLKLFLNTKSRQTLPDMHQEYHEKWNLLEEAKKGKMDNIETLKKDLRDAEMQLSDASLGLEHLMREIGQIYEALTDSNIPVAEDLRKNAEKLPKAAAKLLLYGTSFEIMDCDAANIPLKWVEAIFHSLLELVGDNHVFVLSILGLQSSGKSTLLNTMFGLQFSVSAGRCTGGVHIQVLDVDKNRHFPFQHVIIIDTEGLHAPELSHLKQDHDNQLATLVTGMADMTLLNIKGENVSEMKDVLQIVVHAFLRINVVHRNIQLHKKCVFIHQNVSAVSAKENMKYGSEKLLESLDEITEEAAVSENIANIHAFREVIDFDSEKDVWYFSDLWLGDPPMAPVNPGYSEKAAETKQHLLHEMANRNKKCMTISHLPVHIRDIWRAILGETFVFSFRNSMAARAYNNLECKSNELSWAMEKDVKDWLHGFAKSTIQKSEPNKINHTGAKLQNYLQAYVSERSEDACKKLNDYIDENNLKDILIQWKMEKNNSMKLYDQDIISRGKCYIDDIREIEKVSQIQEEKLATYEKEILKKATEVADEKKGKPIPDDELESIFDELWSSWIAEFTAKEPHKEDGIKEVVLNSLYENFAKDAQLLDRELKTSDLAEPLPFKDLTGTLVKEDIKEEYLSIHALDIFSDDTEDSSVHQEISSCKTHAIIVADKILNKIETYLNNLKKTDAKFWKADALEIIQNLITGIADYNDHDSKTYHFNLLPTFTVKLAVYAFRYAIPVFEAMNCQYENKHSVVGKLKSKRQTFLNIFKHKVKENSEDIIAVVWICGQIVTLAINKIKADIVLKVIAEIVNHFSFTKRTLLVDILDDLADKGSFENYKQYVSDSSTFALKWLTEFTDDYFFESNGDETNKYVQHTKAQMEAIIDCIKTSIKHATEESNSGMEKWMKTFCTGIEGVLVITDNDMKRLMQNRVADLINFQCLLLGSLESIRLSILSHFQCETATSIMWDGSETPYAQIMNKLWGCEEQCPFCTEPCQYTKHSENRAHRCVQHRPQGVGGMRCDWSKELSILTCNQAVASSFTEFQCSYRCQKYGCPATDEIWHKYIEYKTYIPQWDIDPTSDSEYTKYWMWFFSKYHQELTEWHHAKLPDIPDFWNDISKDNAKKSLRKD